ncbi:MAG: 1-acyl-sn-glycerol-3-phosphate acyltransferase [Clostridia bacterium]|nr:1-acyl-sn-glycerol-3-phosphate acyltransferase [Clostridia bacterium]
MTFYSFAKLAMRAFYKLFFRVEVYGEENIPKDSGYLLAPNHLSMYDPPLIGGFFPRMDLHAMSKKEAFDVWILKFILPRIKVFPVDRDGNDITAIKTSLKILKGGEGLLIFPEGTRNKKTDGTPLDAKPGVALIAIKAKVPIIPVTVDSTYKLFSKIKITYHPVVSLEEYEGQKLDSETYQKLTQSILQITYDHLAINQKG